MSQYPSPYSPPSYTPSYGMFPDVLAPARRAGMLLIILGALMFVYALCNGASSALMPQQELEKFQSELSTAAGESPFSPQTMRTLTVVFSAVVAVLGIVYIFCGTLTRKGNGAATIVSLVLNSIFLLVSVLFLIATIVISLAMPMMILGACIVLAATSLFGLGEFWLFQSLKVPSQLAYLQQQYQMQLWQYQQQAQAYAMGYQQMNPQPPQAPPSNVPPSPDDAPRN